MSKQLYVETNLFENGEYYVVVALNSSRQRNVTEMWLE